MRIHLLEEIHELLLVFKRDMMCVHEFLEISILILRWAASTSCLLV